MEEAVYMGAAKTPGQRIIEMREKKNWNQKELAVRAGIAPSQLSRIEGGRTEKISSDILIRLAETLQVSADEILGIGAGESAAAGAETGDAEKETGRGTGRNGRQPAAGKGDPAREQRLVRESEIPDPIRRIQKNLSSLTETQGRVADYIVRNPFDAAVCTIDQMAAEARTSTTTILRLVGSAGYSGYSDFQKQLQDALREKYNPAHRLEVSLADLDETNIWQSCFSKQMNRISSTFSSVSQEALEEAVKEMSEARHAYYSGGRSGRIVAHYLTDNFSRMFGNSSFLDSEQILMWTSALQWMNGEDLLLVIGYPRYARHLLELVRLAGERGVRIIVMTDSYSSPFVKYADTVLICEYESSGFHNSPLPAMMLAECLISAAALQHSDELRERLEKIGKLQEELNYLCT